MPRLLHTLRGSFLSLVSLTLAMAALADHLFFDRPVGVSVALFAAALLAAFALRHGLRAPSRQALIALLAFLGLLLALAKEPRPLAILLALLALGAFVLTRRAGPAHSLRAFFLRHLILLGGLFYRPVSDQLVAARWFIRHPRLWPAWTRVAFLWILPLAAATVFLALFVAGNPIIAEYAGSVFQRLVRLILTLPDWLSPARAALWVAAALTTYALLRASRRRRAAVLPRAFISLPPAAGRTETAIATRCLIAFNAIFALESIVDLTYLWGGAALPRGLTYASFAHRAAYPLLAATLLAAAFALLVFRPRGPGHQSRASRILVHVWLAQNAFLVLSTLWRLKLYVDVFSLTRWRIAAMIWCALIGVGLVLIILKVARHKSATWLVRGNFAALAAVLYLCAFVNWESTIANFNVRHCREIDHTGVSLDIDYLRDLGPAALPALIRVRPQLPTDKAALAAAHIATLKDDLSAQLSDWRGWTLDRSRLSNNIGLPQIVHR